MAVTGCSCLSRGNEAVLAARTRRAFWRRDSEILMEEGRTETPNRDSGDVSVTRQPQESPSVLAGLLPSRCVLLTQVSHAVRAQSTKRTGIQLGADMPVQLRDNSVPTASVADAGAQVAPPPLLGDLRHWHFPPSTHRGSGEVIDTPEAKLYRLKVENCRTR